MLRPIRRRSIGGLLFLLMVGLPHVAFATQQVALLIGNNRGGPGQADLRFAHDDAQRLQEVLIELSGFSPEQVTLLIDPDRDLLLASLQEIGERLSRNRAQGQETLFLFFYSGHARATSLTLGSDDLDLGDVRARLTSLPADVTLAIFDACQSGAISGIKGAQPARDFSYNSVAGLNTAGIAVMASSSGSELSQESEALGGSYFTNNLVAALRGTADSDHDGRVTLAEAYTYTYAQTLSDTAVTAVGRQHVTLETDLRGKGDMVLAYPGKALATLLLPEELSAAVLIQRLPTGSVMAEITKVPGEAFALALPAGAYRALAREAKQTRQCELRLVDNVATRLDVDGCVVLPPPTSVAKGGTERSLIDDLGIEVSGGLALNRRDSYIDALHDFRFDERGGLFGPPNRVSARYVVAALYRLHPNLELALQFNDFDRQTFTRGVVYPTGGGKEQKFSWATYGLGAVARGGVLHGMGRAYVQAGLGLGWGVARFVDDAGPTQVDDRDTQYGYHLGVAAGIEAIPWGYVGLLWHVGYDYAPIVKNLLGERHNSGGWYVTFGLRGEFVGLADEKAEY